MVLLESIKYAVSTYGVLFMVFIVAIYFIPSAGAFSMVDNAIDWINLYSVGSAICFRNIYPLDSDLPSG